MTFSVDTANSLCNRFGLDTEKMDGCYMLVADLEANRITQEEFTAGLSVLTGKEPEEVLGILKGIEVSPTEIPEVVMTEIEGSVRAYIPGVRAVAELSRLTPPEAALYDLEPNNWLWFNRLINQSGIPRIGTLLLDKVFSYCEEKGYSILNEVNAYGAISQKELEDWYIRKGFTPVDYKKYGNKLLKWSPPVVEEKK
jgi:hypothetical protein